MLQDILFALTAIATITFIGAAIYFYVDAKKGDKDNQATEHHKE